MQFRGHLYDAVAEWLRQWIANPFFGSSNLPGVSYPPVVGTREDGDDFTVLPQWDRRSEGHGSPVAILGAGWGTRPGGVLLCRCEGNWSTSVIQNLRTVGSNPTSGTMRECMELVYRGDLKSSVERHRGSNPLSRTVFYQEV